MNYVCFICKDNISGYKKFENHILNDHNLTLTKYYDIEHNTNSVCMKCGNESMFDKSLKKPKQYNLFKEAMKAYTNKLIIGISTAGDNENSFLGNRLKYCRKVF